MSLSYEKNVDLAVNTTLLRSNADKYKSIAEKLRTLSQELNACLLELTSGGWTTEAGHAFFDEVFKNDWEKNITLYADLLDTLRDILYQSADKYDDLIVNHIEKTKI